MQKQTLSDSINAIKVEMEPFAFKWAKVNKRVFEAKFKVHEESTYKELTDQLARLKAIHKGDFAELLTVWNRLPERQWETTFQQQMRHLPEYQDLRKALVKFKSNFSMPKRKPNAEQSTSQQDRDQEVRQ